MSWVGNIDFGKAAWRGGVDGIDNKPNVRPYVRPLLLAEHYNRNSPISEVLLVTHVLVGGQKEVEPAPLLRAIRRS